MSKMGEATANSLPADQKRPTAPSLKFQSASLWRRVIGPYLGCLFRVALGAIFVVAALPKIGDPQAFATNISNYHLLPDGAINALAITLPWVELLSGASLILGIYPRANLVVVALLLAVFILAIGLAMGRGLDISCGCFSVPSADAQRMTRATLYWDIGWLWMALHALAFERGLLSLPDALRRWRQR